MLDLEAVRSYTVQRELAWEPRDVILYHLGLGAGSSPIDPGELAYTYEPRLRVLPTFSVVPAFEAMMAFLYAPELGFSPTTMLHAEHELIVSAPLPAAAASRTDVAVADVLDKGSGALVVIDATTRDVRTGATFCVNRFGVFVRGAGGFGGPQGGRAPAPPLAPPEHRVRRTTLPQQALLFRLSGDWNPLHVDPEVAQAAGFPRPILHGLCTYGIVFKAVVDVLLGGDAARVTGFRARFCGPVFPGETLAIELWRQRDGIAVAASVVERSAPVLSHGFVYQAFGR
ncbi:MAG TPA: MaoC/PaaZ C-terminal domain-containing protein [Solirubrobacter sp.]|nr:MaoC/PaaZ C-terminal domain-containing protein [Solirubrobacter sp.]